MFRQFLTAATLIMGTTVSANAADLRLSTPMAAGIINEPGVDMVFYYTNEEDGSRVVATYLAKANPSGPNRIASVLQQGETVSFTLPTEPSLVLTFARNEHGIDIHTHATHSTHAALAK